LPSMMIAICRGKGRMAVAVASTGSWSIPIISPGLPGSRTPARRSCVQAPRQHRSAIRNAQPPPRY